MFPKSPEQLRLEAQARIESVTLEAEHLREVPPLRRRLAHTLRAIAQWLEPEPAEEEASAVRS